MPGLQYRHKGAIYRITVQAADPLYCVDGWIYETLHGDTTLAGLVAAAQYTENSGTGSVPTAPAAEWLFGDVGSEAAPEPFIYVWLEASSKVDYVMAGRADCTLFYGIAGVSRSRSYAGLTAINKRIEALLNVLPTVSMETLGIDRSASGEAGDTIIGSQIDHYWRQAEIGE